MRPSPRPAPARLARAAAALTALLAAACVEVTGPDDGTGSTGGPDAGGSVPSEIVGEWRWGSISPTNFWNDHTGVYSGNAYGMSDHYVFNRNGTFKEYVYIYTQSYGCRTQVWVEMGGTVEFGGSSFAKTVTSGRFKTTDTCASSRNMDRSMTEAERRERSKSHDFALRTDNAGKRYIEILEARYDRAN
jgi:hypothetical protein